MKRIFCVLCVCLLVALMPVSVWAETVIEPEETAVEAVETVVEAEETEVTETALSDGSAATSAVVEGLESAVETAEEVAETEANTLSDEVAGMVSAATPEQIEQIKEYLLYGAGEVSKLGLPFLDQVALWVTSNVDILAWIFAGLAFIVFVFVFKAKGKRLEDSATTMTNNACELYARGEKLIEAAHAESEERVKAMLEQAQEIHNKALDELSAVKCRETACAEALELLATEINSLLQVANLPEWKRDELQAVFNKAHARVEKVKPHDEQGGEG